MSLINLASLGLFLLNDILLLLFKRFNVLSQLIVFFLEGFDVVVHVSLRLVSNQRLLETVCNRTVVELLQG